MTPLAPYIARGWRCEPSEARGELVEVVRWAAGKIGTVEHPIASNKGPEIDVWLKAAGVPPGSAWCAAFLSAAYALAPGVMPRMASAYKVKRWAVKNGRLLAPDVPLLVGDIVGVLREDFHGHVGMFTADIGDGQGAYIEANVRSAVRGTVHPRSDWQWACRPLPLV
jgi:hypothetical protein